MVPPLEGEPQGGQHAWQVGGLEAGAPGEGVLYVDEGGEQVVGERDPAQLKNPERLLELKQKKKCKISDSDLITGF